jgi:hypothetical protein
MNKLIAPLRPQSLQYNQTHFDKNKIALPCTADLICAYADNLDCFLLVCYKQKK